MKSFLEKFIKRDNLHCTLFKLSSLITFPVFKNVLECHKNMITQTHYVAIPPIARWPSEKQHKDQPNKTSILLFLSALFEHHNFSLLMIWLLQHETHFRSHEIKEKWVDGLFMLN